jgi:pyruvate formate lyase activating enzyme
MIMPRPALTRRDFIWVLARCGVAIGGAGLVLSHPDALERLLGAGSAPAGAAPATALADLIREAPRARYWISSAMPAVACSDCHLPEDLDGQTGFDHAGRTVIRCQLCAQNCLIAEGGRGRCRARINVGGELRSLVYGRPITIHIDPIEKKPFYHFLPGREAFSLATSGCPLHCKFCQNWEISQARPEDYTAEFVPPENIARASLEKQAPIVAFTYNEPTVFVEYLTDIARAGREHGLRSVLISCGFMNEAPLAEMCDCLDAIKIDLKGFSEDFYVKVSSAALRPVLRSIKQVSRSRVHLEIVNLVVPTLNDSPQMLSELAKWMAGEIGPDVPVHFTRFHPDYQLQNLPPTPVATLERAWDIALAQGLHYAYVGNVPGHPGNHTYCPGCGKIVIERRGFFIAEMKIQDGLCTYCRTPIAGVWK